MRIKSKTNEVLNDIDGSVIKDKSQSDKKKHFLGILWLIFDKGLKILLTVFSSVLVANYLGGEKYGNYGYVIAFTGLFINIPFLGMKNYVSRDLTEKEFSESTIISTSFYVSIIGAVATIIIINICSIFYNWGDANLFKLVLIGSVFYGSFWIQITESFFISIYRAKIYSVFNIISALIAFGLKIYGIDKELNLKFFIWVYAFENLFLCSLILVWNKFYKRFIWKYKLIDLAYFKKIIRESLPFVIAGFGVSIYLQIDQLMIMKMIDAKSNGIYALTARICSSLYFLPVAICNALIPAIAISKSKGKEIYEHRFKILFGSLFWLGLLSAVCIFLVTPYIINIFLSKEYLDSIDITQIYIWSLVFVFIGVGQDKWIVQERHYMILVEKAIFGALLNISLNLYMIPVWGLEGAAIATIISYVFSGYLYCAFRTQTKPLFLLQTYSIGYVLKEGIKKWKI